MRIQSQEQNSEDCRTYSCFSKSKIGEYFILSVLVPVGQVEGRWDNGEKKELDKLNDGMICPGKCLFLPDLQPRYITYIHITYITFHVDFEP